MPDVPPPAEPSYGRSCDAGGCDAESIGWRFFPWPAPGQWLPGNAPDSPPDGRE